MTTLRLMAATAFLASVVAAQGRFSFDPLAYSTAVEALDAENYLHSHPDDSSVLKRLLDYYEARWQTNGAERLRLILWTIQNHPDVALDPPHDGRALLVNPDDKQDYAQARQFWLKQVRQYPDHPRVLENAAICLRLTDRESAADWLKRAIALSPDRRNFLASALGDVYAAAITGISGMNPWEGPTVVDVSQTSSEFARRARMEAATDAEIAARTGWAVYLSTEAFQRLSLSHADYDTIAEELLLKSAAPDFPKPSRFGLLGTFYQRQEMKKSGQVLPKSRMVAVPSEEQAKRVLSKTTSDGVTGEKRVVGPVHVTVDVVVGTDGHVWKAAPENAPTELIRSAASAAVMSWTYQPLEIEGEVVRVATRVEVGIDSRP
jgi:tetratricopeptide (TPR) repeat protein